MSDFGEFDRVPVPAVVEEEPPVEVVDAAPASTEPPAVELPAEVVVPAVHEKEPPLRITAEGVVLSKVVVSPEGVILKVED